MSMNKIVDQLRAMSLECENELVYLPCEIAKIINGKQEEDWEMVRADKTLQYIADMLEE